MIAFNMLPGIYLTKNISSNYKKSLNHGLLTMSQGLMIDIHTTAARSLTSFSNNFSR